MGRPRGSSGTKQLTSDQRQRVRTLYHDAKMGQAQIQAVTGYTASQIRYAIRSKSSSVMPRPGRPRIMSSEQEEELVRFVCASPESRRMTFLQLSAALFDAVFGMWAIKHCLNRLGFRRRLARERPPPLTEEGRDARLRWALQHRHWPPDRWAKVLWTDVTWVAAVADAKQYVTRRDGEQWDPTCVADRRRPRVGGAMFCGYFSSAGKGPGVLWEKDWGAVDAEAYRQDSLPLVDEWLPRCRRDLGVDLVLMQDEAPGHGARPSPHDMAQRGIPMAYWPPYSPDLSPVESCWDWMKDYIEDKYGLEDKPLHDKIRRHVEEAWEALPDSLWIGLLAEMPQRCEAVIRANGMHTNY